MKIKELIESIERHKKTYPDFEEWDMFIEVVTPEDYTHKKERGWHFFKDGEGWEYIKMAGWNTTCPKEKAFTFNANY